MCMPKSLKECFPMIRSKEEILKQMNKEKNLKEFKKNIDLIEKITHNVI